MFCTPAAEDDDEEAVKISKSAAANVSFLDCWVGGVGREFASVFFCAGGRVGRRDANGSICLFFLLL